MKTTFTWVPVTKSFPPKNVVCIVIVQSGRVCSNTLMWNGYNWVSPDAPDETGTRQDITHWKILKDLEAKA
jgi:hypothetical protein